MDKGSGTGKKPWDMYERVTEQGRILCRQKPAKYTPFIGYIGSDYFQ